MIILLAENMRIVDNYRRSRGLRRSDVIGVTPATARWAIRGLSGDFKVITHETWNPAPEIEALVRQHLAIAAQTRPHGGTPRCGHRGFAGAISGTPGCVRAAGHPGRCDYSDGTGEQDPP